MVNICLFPSPFKRKWCDFLVSTQRSINLLQHRIAHDDEFLEEALSHVIVTDDFTRKLFNIYKRVRDDPNTQPVSLGLFRSDYLLNDEPECPKQVEMNAIAVSIGGLTPILQDLQRYLFFKHGIAVEPQFPTGRTDERLAGGLVKCFEFYGKKDAEILIIHEEVSLNISDQKAIEIAVQKIKPGIRTTRKSFSDLHGLLVCTADGRLLHQEREIAVVYYRHGYSPEDYTPENVELRVLIERSKAIKCPSIRYHLAAVKKIQQLLTNPTLLRRFLPEDEHFQPVYSTFTTIHHLNHDAEGDKAYQLAINHPERYVLKPQREGGGNNIFGKDIVSFLKSIKKDASRESYILMELIKPKPVLNYPIHASKTIADCGHRSTEMIDEIGVFGVVMGRREKIIENFEAGIILRSKVTGCNETGIVAGYGYLNAVSLS